jgi:hypothetical protein
MLRALIVLLNVTGLAAAQPKKDEPVLYYPTREGDKRVYETKGADGKTREMTQVVTKIEKKDGIVRVSLGFDLDGETYPYEEVEVSEKGVVRLVFARRKLDPPSPMLQLPAKPGDKWEYQPRAARGEFPKTKTTVGKEEDVEVPAGKFKAIRIDHERDGKDSERQTQWYAPRVGLVKTITVRDGKETVSVLKSFTPGK